MTKKSITKKQIRKYHTILRRMIQILFFFLYPSLFTAAFSGVKYIFTQLGAGAAVGWTSFIAVLVSLCVYTIVFGRFFCGYACAFGSFGDLLHGIYRAVCRKLKKKPLKLSRYHSKSLASVKYYLLAVITGACFFDFYGKLRYSPWDVFSMVTALKPKWQGYILGWILLLILMLGMTVKERFFCRFICPMGAVFSLLPVLPFFSLHRDREHCRKGCRACTACCPSDVELPDRGSIEVCGDCFQCGRCTDTCPGANIQTGIPDLKGNELYFTVLRAAVLIALCIALNI